jgi:hypothetical protein
MANSISPKLELRGRTYPTEKVEQLDRHTLKPTGAGDTLQVRAPSGAIESLRTAGVPTRSDALYLQDGENFYRVQARGIDFGNVRLGEDVRVGELTGKVVGFADRPDTWAQAFNATVGHILQTSDQIGMELGVLAARAQALALGRGQN